jgi:hypothetical protein
MLHASSLLARHPGRIPVILIPSVNIDIDKCKYLVDGNTTISSFLFMLRKHISVHNFQAVFLFINNTLVPNNSTFFSLYNLHKNPDDDFLYIHLRLENTFG